MKHGSLKGLLGDTSHWSKGGEPRQANKAYWGLLGVVGAC